jgi:5-methylcytosine-specific restriction endonuclease McrA
MSQPGGFVVSSRGPSLGGLATGEGSGVPSFPVAAAISRVVALLESVSVADLSTTDLVEVVAGWQQVAGMVVAHQGRAISELQARSTPMGEFVTDELACALVTTRAAVDVLANRAAGLAAFPVLAEALLAGTVDARKVDVILAETLPLAFESERARAVEESLCAARGLTGPQLARHVRRHVLGLDPKVAKKRAELARADRSVELQWANDSMARLVAFIPAECAVNAFTALDALAATTGDALDHRSVDQRRADAFADIFATIVETEHTPAGDRLPRKHRQPVAVHVTVAATTLLGLDEHPGELTGYGPIPAHLARELAQDGTWRRILTDPTGQFLQAGTRTYRPGADLTRTIQTRDATCTWPGCRQPATRTELDHIQPYNHATHPGEAPADADHIAIRHATELGDLDSGRGQVGEPHQTRPDNLHALCKRHHQAKTTKLWNVRRDKTTGNTIWTSPLGITYSRSPIPVLIAPSAYQHRPPVPWHDDAPPPF